MTSFPSLGRMLAALVLGALVFATPAAPIAAAPFTELLQPFGSPSVAKTTITLCVGFLSAQASA